MKSVFDKIEINEWIVVLMLKILNERNPAVMLGIKNQRVALSLPVLAAVTSSAQHPWIQVIQNKLAGIIIFNKFIFFYSPILIFHLNLISTQKCWFLESVVG